MFDLQTSQNGFSEYGGESFSAPTVSRETANKVEPLRLIADKLQIPQTNEQISRPRLKSFLAKSLNNFGAALVTGRAGTGKTALAADFAANSNRQVAWYTIESADSDWRIFANYLLGSLNKLQNAENGISANPETVAAQFGEAEKPLLVVLDDAHCVFDAEWFAGFFQMLLPIRESNVQLIMLSRSLPPLPLWRMRSKQMLGVIDENLLAFTPEETILLFAQYNLSANLARLMHRETFGRAAKLKQFVEMFSVEEANWVI